MLLAFSQPVNCVFWTIETLNWLVAASKLHKHRGTCYTAEWPYCPFAILCPNYKEKTLMWYQNYEVKDVTLSTRRQMVFENRMYITDRMYVKYIGVNDIMWGGGANIRIGCKVLHLLAVDQLFTRTDRESFYTTSFLSENLGKNVKD